MEQNVLSEKIVTRQRKEERTNSQNKTQYERNKDERKERNKIKGKRTYFLIKNDKQKDKERAESDT